MRLDWNTIDTCFLDMDGTLLDLYQDHKVWHVELPRRLASKDNLNKTEAKLRIELITEEHKGTLSWYDLDFWKRTLDIDIDEIEIALSHYIRLRTGAIEFLLALQQKPLTLFLVTNAHPRGLERKLEKTLIGKYFDHIISSHEIGLAKESLGFWTGFHRRYNFDKSRSILLDDNLNVLKAAKEFGIKHTYGVQRPNSKGEAYSSEDFFLIENYSSLL